MYFVATQKELDEGPDNLRLWINYIDLLSAESDTAEVREIFRMLKLRYWRFLDYWRSLIDFEIKRRSPDDFERKVVANAVSFLRTKEFGDKRVFVEYLNSFRGAAAADARRGSVFLQTKLESCGRGRSGATTGSECLSGAKSVCPLAEEAGKPGVRFNNTKIRVPFGGKAGDTDLNITLQVREMERSARSVAAAHLEPAAENGAGRSTAADEKLECSFLRPSCGEDEHQKLPAKCSKAPPICTNLTYPTPSDADTPQVNGILAQRRRGVEMVNVKLETVEVPLLEFKGERLHLIKELGKGGSSRVYQVLYKDQVFALKRVSLKEEQRESFCDEIQLLRKLKGSRGIIELVDYDPKDSELDLLLECGDTDLGSFIRSNTLTLSFVRDMWEQILEIVSLVHGQRIVHKDLKPANFLFVKGRLKLIDFGISKEMKNDTTKIFNETQIGTVNYMSPESLDRDIRLGRSTDVWSLGCILYEMIYRQTPLSKYTNVVQKIKKLQDEAFQIEYPETPLWELIPVVKRCLVRDWTKRATVEELLCRRDSLSVTHSDLLALARAAIERHREGPEAIVGDFVKSLRTQNWSGPSC